MLQLTYTGDQQVLREVCRGVLDGELPLDVLRREAGFEDEFKDLWVLVTELGWVGLSLPETLGGMGLSLVDLSVVAEEHGRHVQPGAWLATVTALEVLSDSTPSPQRGHYVSRLLSGEIGTFWSVADHLSGDPPQVVSTGDGFRIDGSIRLVTEAERASIAIVEARRNAEIVHAVIELGDAGVTRRTTPTMDLIKHFATVDLDSVALRPESVWAVSPDVASRGLDAALVLQCGESVGAAERCLEMTVEYVLQRRQFDHLIGEYQAIKHRIADMKIRLEAARVATRYAAWAVNERRQDASTSAHIAKQCVGEAATWIASEAIQVHGGIGFTWEHDLHHYLRRVKVNDALLGNSEWHARQLGQICMRAARNSKG